MGKRSRQRNREARKNEPEPVGAGPRSGGQRPGQPSPASGQYGLGPRPVERIRPASAVGGGSDRSSAQQLDRAILMLEALTHVGKPGILTADEKRTVRGAFDSLAPGDRGVVHLRIHEWIDRGLRVAFDHHWLPDDLCHFTRIKTDDVHEAAMATAIVSWTSRKARIDHAPPEWLAAYEQVADAAGIPFAAPSVDTWCRLIALVTILQRTITLPRRCAPPSAWTASGAEPPKASTIGLTPDQVAAAARKRGLDPKVLERVRALLAKAEGTSFEEEADAFTAKAQEMMTKHGIEAALLEAADESVAPVQRRIWIENPYADAKGLLLSAIARVNRCEAIFHTAVGCHSVVGFAADLDAVEVLFTSLLVQGATFVMAQGSQVDRFGRSSTASFRRSFWVSYGSRIGERLQETVAKTVAEADAEYHGTLLPVLASREQKVREEYERAFPNVTRKSYNVSNRAGWEAGKVAADQADISAAKARIGRS